MGRDDRPATVVVQVADLRLDPQKKSVERDGAVINLTPKEFMLLEYLARHAGQVVTRTMISEHVWDMNFDSFSNVIDVYIRYLRRPGDHASRVTPLPHHGSRSAPPCHAMEHRRPGAPT